MPNELGMSGSEEVRNESHVARRRIPGVKSVLVSDDLIDFIRGLQAGTSPRLDYRYLIEGVITSIQKRPELFLEVEVHARNRMQRDLANLNQHQFSTIVSEHKS